MAISVRRAAFLLSSLLSASPALAQTPVLEFDFDEGSGTTATNSGSLGEASNGSIHGATYSTVTPFGTGFSLAFDGDTDFIEVADTFDYGEPVTVEAWIKPDAIDGQRVLYDDYGNPGVFMGIVNGKLQFNISTAGNPGPGISVVEGTICPGLWQHVAGTYDGSKLRAYVDGVEVGSVITSGAIFDNAGNAAHIGAESGSPDLLEFKGDMDDFRLFLNALLPDELGSGTSLMLCGELTGDCGITAGDALAALRMAVGLDDVDPAADMNDNGSVTASDALNILRIAVGAIEHTAKCNGPAGGAP